MKREKISMKTKFGDELFGYAWTVEKPVGNIVLVTGMEEYALRYDDFATFLCKNNYNVYCLDHYGQGETAGSEDRLGIVPTSFFSKSVKNIDEIVTKCRVSLLPTTIIAHSMGSFMLQDYIQRFTQHVNKVVFVGTSGPNQKFLFRFGRAFARLLLNKKNRDKKAHFLNNMLFVKGYGNKIKDRETQADWISLSRDNVDAYIKDPYCGYVSTYGFFYEFMKGLSRIYKKEFLKKIRKDMHVLIIAGDKDPVGQNGKGPTALVKLYSKLGLEDVNLSLKNNLRHEILNEEEKQEIYDEILAFVKKEVEPAEEILK